MRIPQPGKGSGEFEVFSVANRFTGPPAFAVVSDWRAAPGPTFSSSLALRRAWAAGCECYHSVKDELGRSCRDP